MVLEVTDDGLVGGLPLPKGFTILYMIGIVIIDEQGISVFDRDYHVQLRESLFTKQ